MLKSKGKAFKPKGPGRRPQPSREPTPSLKRKEREDDTTPQPPAKRLSSPKPEVVAPVEERVISSIRETVSKIPQQQYPTPEPSQTSASEVLPQTIETPAINVSSESTQDVSSAINTTQDVGDPSDLHSENPPDIPSAADEQPSQSITGATLGPAGGAIMYDSHPTNQGPAALPLGPAGDVGAGSSNSQIARVSQVIPMEALNPDGTSGGIIEEPTKKGKKKKVMRKKKVQATQEGDDVRATIEMQLNKPKRAKKDKRARNKDKRRKQRAMTPEGAEEETIDPIALTMSDLCKDLRIGKKFSKHQNIKDRITAKKVTADIEKARKKHPEMVALLEGQATSAANGEGVATDAPTTEETTINGQNVRLRIIDGQIVVDERSLQIDRQKQGQVQQQEMEIVEENDFTNIFTSGTHMKREKAQIWDHAALELFYEGLRTFGTDFGMIANMFPHRNRRQIKLKYNKEERENPNRITRALNGPRLDVNFEKYEKLSNLTFEAVHEIDAEMQATEKEQNAEQAAHAAVAAETNRKKKEAIKETSNAAKRILDSVGEEDDGGSAKENREPSAGGRGRSKSREPGAAAQGRGKKKAGKGEGRNKKIMHSHRAGGEEVEVFGDA